MSGNEGILSLGSGVSRESGKIKGGPAGEGEMVEGGGGVRHGWERQREITLHWIYLMVPKGIDKVSLLSSCMVLHIQ
jgi:hypothetical protein